MRSSQDLLSMRSHQTASFLKILVFQTLLALVLLNRDKCIMIMILRAKNIFKIYCFMKNYKIQWLRTILNSMSSK